MRNIYKIEMMVAIAGILVLVLFLLPSSPTLTGHISGENVTIYRQSLDILVDGTQSYTLTTSEDSLHLKKLALYGEVIGEGRVEILKSGEGQKGLLEAADEAGIRNVLIDTAVIDVTSIGLSARAIYIIKSELGFPVGCGPSNAITTWKKVKKEMGPYAYSTSLAGSCIITQSLGANFVLYGPVEGAEAVFPACAMADAIIAYNARRFGIKSKTRQHPLFKIF